jgi:hypothetical protein
MRAGRIRVDVLPPVPTAGWIRDRLDGEIAALRRLYPERLDSSPSALVVSCSTTPGRRDQE